MHHQPEEHRDASVFSSIATIFVAKEESAFLSSFFPFCLRHRMMMMMMMMMREGGSSSVRFWEDE
jgi:hypothetical protein